MFEHAEWCRPPLRVFPAAKVHALHPAPNVPGAAAGRASGDAGVTHATSKAKAANTMRGCPVRPLLAAGMARVHADAYWNVCCLRGGRRGKAQDTDPAVP